MEPLGAAGEVLVLADPVDLGFEGVEVFGKAACCHPIREAPI